MSKPREKWWGYAKAMIRDYPRLKSKYDELHTPSFSSGASGMPSAHKGESAVENLALRELPKIQQKELDAVSAAIEATKTMPNAKERLAIIDLVFWKKSYTLYGAAAKVHVSERTAKRYHGAFIYLVAEKFGLK